MGGHAADDKDMLNGYQQDSSGKNYKALIENNRLCSTEMNGSTFKLLAIIG
jgi:hypothetical protein